MKALVISLLSAASLLCFVFAWISNARHTRELDRLGIAYGCKRWPEEGNRNYYRRLQARIGWRTS
jgi:hypothetical protein